MNTGKRIAALLLIFVLFCCTGLEAYAVTESQDGLSVTLTTDKQSYLPGEAINVSLLLTNGNSFSISSVHAQVSAPDGYILAAGYAESMSTASLGAGKSLQLVIRYLEQNSVPVPLPTLGPDRVGVATGDRANLPLWIALAVVSLAALMLLALRKKIWKRFFCLLLCFVMLGGIADPVYAANDQAQKTIRVATPVKVGNRDLTVQGVVSYTMGSEVSPSPTPTTVPSPTPTAQPSPTPAPTPSPVPGEYFTVSYQLNYEGAGEYLSQQVEKGSCAQEPSSPSREGHTFMGWYKSGETTEYDFSTPVLGNLTLNAVWSYDVGNKDSIYVLSEDRISVDDETGVRYTNDMIFALIEEGLSESEKSEIAKAAGGMIEAEFEGPLNVLQIRVNRSLLTELESLANSLEKVPNVYYASVDILIKDDDITLNSVEKLATTTEYEDWWYKNLGVSYVWNQYERFLSPVTVGVIDGYLDSQHEDLTGKVSFASPEHEHFNRRNVGEAFSNDAILKDVNHGTHITGIIVAENNGIGTTGVNPKANVVFASRDFMPNSQVEIQLFSEIKLLYSLNCQIEQGSKAINCSFGLTYESGKGESEKARKSRSAWRDMVTEATCYLISKDYDFLIIATAGNGVNNSGPGVDAIYNGTWTSITENSSDLIRQKYGNISFDELKSHWLVVGSILESHNGTVYEMNPDTNYGSTVDIYAPGVDVYGPWYYSNKIPSVIKYSYGSGTSVAAPIVTGVASLVWAANPRLTAAQVREILLNNTRFSAQGTYVGTTYTRPVVDAKLAVEEALRRYDHRIVATITDGTNPLSGVVAEMHCVMAGFKELTIQVAAEDDGSFFYKIPDDMVSATIVFKKDGYRDYEYVGELNMSSSNDLGEIVLEAKLVPDTVEAMTYLKDADTGTAIAGAQVQAFSGSGEIPVAVASSDDAGYLCIELPENTLCKLKIRCEGYNSRELDLQLEEPLWFGENGTGLGEADAVLYLQKADVFEGFAGGDGSMNNPYQIANAKQLNAIRNGLSAHYVLIDDIDLSAYSPWVPIGTGNTGFTGSLNGQGHTVSNLLINDDSAKAWAEQNTWDKNKIYLGLFGVAAGTTNSVPWEPIWTTFKNINLSEVHIDISDEFINSSSGFNEMYLGSLCGFTNRARTEDCSSSGSINVSGTDLVQCYVGGLFGETYNGFVYRCSNYADVNADLEGTHVCCGGITGSITRFFGDEITNCTNYGDISCINNTSPDIFCGGIAGFADYRVFQCRNEGDIYTEAKAWGKPNSACYRQQTGGIVGLFCGRPASENASAEIIECENYGNVEAISFVGYSDGSNYGENDYTGGICGGFQCLSSFEDWSALIADCTNYAQNIRATRRVIESDGSSTVYASPWTGRIGGYPPSQTFLYSNNASDPATLLNGAVCTENIGAETKNGANLGEEDTEDENGTLNISVLEGTWSNGLPEDNYSGFYLTEFGSDGTVVQKGYRNIDKGRFEITGANTAVATFDDNYYDTTGVGYQKIADYSYTVTYTYDKYSDTLLADYSDVFENAANSNACDGTLSRWSGSPLHEQIKDIVLGTQEDDMPEQEPQDYQSFLTSQAYLDYAEGWTGSGETYAILDINQDGVDELIVNSPNDFGFMYSLIFTKNYEGQIVRLANEYHYGYIRYSAEHSAIEYSELNPTPDLGNSGFFAISGGGLVLVLSISWDSSEGTENSQIYYPSSGESVPISAEERQAYFGSLQNLNWVSLT